MKQIKNYFLIFLTLPILLLAEAEALNEKWLEADKSNLINLIKVMKTKSLDANFYKKNLRNLDVRSEKEVGFGVKEIQAYQYGGYISNEVSIYTYNDEIFYFRVRATGKDLEKIEILKERDSVISKFISQNWVEDDYQPYPSLVPTVVKRIKYEYLNKKTYLVLTKYVGNYLGNFLDIPIDSSLENEYKVLTSPFEKYDFGTACGYGGTRPKGRQAIEIIKKANPQLLKNIIRGYSVEGRIYGVEALLELASKNTIKLTDDDILTIKKVLNLDISINQCGGCMSSSLVAKEIFEGKKYKELLFLNNINI